jgi:hypothetical protein
MGHKQAQGCAHATYTRWQPRLFIHTRTHTGPQENIDVNTHTNTQSNPHPQPPNSAVESHTTRGRIPRGVQGRVTVEGLALIFSNELSILVVTLVGQLSNLPPLLLLLLAFTARALLLLCTFPATTQTRRGKGDTKAKPPFF